MDAQPLPDDRGSASVEQAGLIALVAALLLSSIALVGRDGNPASADLLIAALARKIACAPQMKAPCRTDPLTEAYGRSVAGAVRFYAPVPRARPGAAGEALVGVDFHRCRQISCAIPAPGPDGQRLTRSNRRTTAFVSVDDQRRGREGVQIFYWIYRPGQAWERIDRLLGSPEVEQAAPTPLLESQNPRLIPLETLPGRNHARFPAIEEPPWRWSIVG